MSCRWGAVSCARAASCASALRVCRACAWGASRVEGASEGSGREEIERSLEKTKNKKTIP